MTSEAKQQSSPFSTGSGGAAFEFRVQAAFAVLMLTKSPAPCLGSRRIVKMKLQGKYADFNTDDCIIYARDGDGGNEAKLLGQIRHSVAFSEGNQALSEAVKAAWADFSDASIFTEGSDAIALMTGPLSATDTHHVLPLLEWARHCEDAGEFIRKVNTARFGDDDKRRKLDVIRSLLKSANGGTDVADEVLWRFLKSFHVIGYDLDKEAGAILNLLHALIAQTAKGEPAAVWGQVICAVQDADPNAGTIALDTLPAALRCCFDGVPDRHWEADLQKLRAHSRMILDGIETTVAGVHVQRHDILGELVNLSEAFDFVLVSGPRGCGKSSIVREFADLAGRRYPVFCLRTEQLNKPHLSEVFSAMGLAGSHSDIAARLAMMPRKFLLLESLEKLLELDCPSTFTDLMNFMRQCPGWTVIASARDYAYQQVTLHYLPRGSRWVPLIVPEFTTEQVNQLCESGRPLAALARNSPMASLLRNPFLAELASRVIAAGAQFTDRDGESAFRTAVWRDVIGKESDRANGMPLRRRQTFVNLAVKRAKAMTYGVPDRDFEPEALLKLEGDSLVLRDADRGLAGPAHDVLEDWALDAYVEDAFQNNKGNARSFLGAVGTEPAMNRAFRLWLQRRLEDEVTRRETTDLVVGILRDAAVQPHWKDEAISAALNGQSPHVFLAALGERLFENEADLLKRFCFVLRISSKVPNHDLIRQMLGSRGNAEEALGALFLRPHGTGWEAVIRFLWASKDRLGAELLPHCVAVLAEWGELVNIDRDLPPPAREAGLLALHFLGMVKDYHHDNPHREKLLALMIKLFPTIEGEFRELVRRDVLAHPPDSRRDRPDYVDELVVMVLKDIDGAPLCKHAPDLVIELALHEWLLTSSAEDAGDWHPDIDKFFGLRSYSDATSFFPASGLKGPFAFLLRYHPREGLDLIARLCNFAADRYAHSTLDTGGVAEVKLVLNDGSCVSQYGSGRLWLGYRGESVLPDLLQSALMALENWLVAMAEQDPDGSRLGRIVDLLLRQSNSVMPTAVVASVATGFPEKMGKAALPLLRAPELYHWDMERSIKEMGASTINWFGPMNYDRLREVHAQDRRTAAMRPWRQEYLEMLVTRLQFTDMRPAILKVLDGLRAATAGVSILGQDESVWRFRLHRIDTRGWQPEADEANKRIVFKTKALEPDLEEMQGKAEKDIALQHRFMKLHMWGSEALEKKTPEQARFASWQEALSEAKSLYDVLREEKDGALPFMYAGAIVTAAAMLFREHSADMAEEDVVWCAQLIQQAVLANAYAGSMEALMDRTGHDGAPASAQVLPILLDFAGETPYRDRVRLLIATALTHANETVRHAAAHGIREHLWQRDPEFAQHCVEGALEYAHLQQQEVLSRRPRLQPPPKVTRGKKKRSREKDWRLLFREKLAAGTVSADLGRFSFDSHCPWHVLAPFLMVPDGSVDSSHKALAARMLALLQEQETRRNGPRSSREGLDRLPGDFLVVFCRRFADYLLSLQEHEARTFLHQLAEGCHTSPGLLRFLASSVLASADRRGDIGLYWRFWNAFADRVAEMAVALAGHEGREAYRGDKTDLIRGMLLTDISWSDIKPDEKLLAPGAGSLCTFVEKAGGNPVVFEAMVQYLHYYPALFGPAGLLILARHQSNAGGTRLLSGVNTVFYLERVMQSVVVRHGWGPLLSGELREAAFVLLNAMVERGSSCAFFLRDHLLHCRRPSTPLPAAAAARSVAPSGPASNGVAGSGAQRQEGAS